MEELETKKYAGIDLGRTSVQFSIYREGQEEMTFLTYHGRAGSNVILRYRLMEKNILSENYI